MLLRHLKWVKKLFNCWCYVHLQSQSQPKDPKIFRCSFEQVSNPYPQSQPKDPKIFRCSFEQVSNRYPQSQPKDPKIFRCSFEQVSNPYPQSPIETSYEVSLAPSEFYLGITKQPYILSAFGRRLSIEILKPLLILKV